MNANNERWLKRHVRTIADAYKKPADTDGKRRVYMYGRRMTIEEITTILSLQHGCDPAKKAIEEAISSIASGYTHD